MDLDGATVADVVRRTLDEDLGPTGDVTAKLCVPGGTRGRAVILARAPGVVAGVAVAEQCFLAIDPEAQVQVHAGDGSAVRPNDRIMEIRGSAAGLVGSERSALNFLQRLSGIATRTRAFVDAVAGTGAAILDTRKTTPGLRALEKYAVRVGGGQNHRFGLFDQVLIKENHFALAAPESLEDVARRAVEASDVGVVAEARNLEEALAVVRGGVAVVLLDNFQPGDELKSVIGAVRAASSEVRIEISGGVVLDNVRAYAECGVDRISIGSLTHSVPALDLSMLVEEDS